jgi:hypothetical protein
MSAARQDLDDHVNVLRAIEAISAGQGAMADATSIASAASRAADAVSIGRIGNTT